MSDQNRALIAIPGTWTDAWFDAPDAWWAWVCAWADWSLDDWRHFRADWARSGDSRRHTLSAISGIRFFDWRLVPGGSILGRVDRAAPILLEQIRAMPADTVVTLVGHSKGGSVIKRLLADARRTIDVGGEAPWEGGGCPRHAVLVGAPVDPVREVVCAAIGLGIRRIQWNGPPPGVRMATINNWYDPSGGRLAGVPNYQVRLWNDHFVPWPPHGMKSFLARQVLADLGAIADPAETSTSVVNSSPIKS